MVGESLSGCLGLARLDLTCTCFPRQCLHDTGGLSRTFQAGVENDGNEVALLRRCIVTGCGRTQARLEGTQNIKIRQFSRS